MMTKIATKTLSLALLGFLFISCAKKEDIAGRFEGTWKTQWEDVLKGDVDDITVEEVIVFQNEGYSGNNGIFTQYFTGNVKYDDWTNETEISYSANVSGTWTVKDKDKIILKYDINSFNTKFGKSNISTGGEEAVYHLLTGDWGGLIADGLKSDSNDKKINKKIEAEVSKQVTSFFRDMFIEMNKDKKAMKKVVIDDNMMTCEVNHGFFGRDASYYRVD